MTTGRFATSSADFGAFRIGNDLHGHSESMLAISQPVAASYDLKLTTMWMDQTITEFILFNDNSQMRRYN